MRSKLLREHYPRLQMGLIVAVTGLAGLGASFALLQAGVNSMGPRYFYAMGIAYIVFLMLLWAWLRLRGDGLDIPSGNLESEAAPHWSGEGGTFDGGGASGDYDLADSAGDSAVDSVQSALDEAAGSVDVDVGDAALPIAALILAAGIVFSSLFVVYTAPVLFAELLVDGVLAAGLYRRLQGQDRRHWLESALRRTFWPFMLTAAVVTAAGWGMGRYAPQASSLGEVLQHRTEMRHAAP